MTFVHVVMPDGVDDPARPSGGNVYDRRMCDGLADLGWSVRELPVAGSWPAPDGADLHALQVTLASIPTGAVGLVDGLIASSSPEVLVREAGRLRLVILVHMPLGAGILGAAPDVVRERERDALTVASAVITTSDWSQERLSALYGLPGQQVHVARPGVDLGELAPGTAEGGRLLCVAAVTPGKGHDVLLAALTELRDLDWQLTCAGSVARDDEFAASLVRRSAAAGLDSRVRFVGARTRPELDALFAAADLLVLASRGESYGMVVTEALAHGLPVVGTAVGGLPEALGRARGAVPGMLVAPGDPIALATALRRWLGDIAVRDRLRRVAADRRETLDSWRTTCSQIAGVLRLVAR